MIDGTLNTTNALLGVLVAVSVVQALAFVGLAMIVFRTENRVLRLAEEVRAQALPAIARLDRLADGAEQALADVHTIAGGAASGMRRAHLAFQTSAAVMGLAGGAAYGPFARRARRALAVARGLKVAYRVLAGVSAARPSASARGAVDRADSAA
jgi:hypothetical protein